MKFKTFPKPLFYLHKNPFLNTIVSRNEYIFVIFKMFSPCSFKKSKKVSFCLLYEKKSGK